MSKKLWEKKHVVQYIVHSFYCYYSMRWLTFFLFTYFNKIRFELRRTRLENVHSHTYVELNMHTYFSSTSFKTKNSFLDINRFHISMWGKLFKWLSFLINAKSYSRFFTAKISDNSVILAESKSNGFFKNLNASLQNQKNAFQILPSIKSTEQNAARSHKQKQNIRVKLNVNIQKYWLPILSIQRSWAAFHESVNNLVQQMSSNKKIHPISSDINHW